MMEEITHYLPIIPFIGGTILFIAGVLFWCFKYVVRHFDKGHMLMVTKVDTMSSKIDMMSGKVDHMSVQKLDRSEYKEGMRRLFDRVEECEAQNMEVSKRITDLEWHTGARKVVCVAGTEQDQISGQER